MAWQYRVGPLTLQEHKKAQAYADDHDIDYWQAAKMVAIPVRGGWRHLYCPGVEWARRDAALGIDLPCGPRLLPLASIG